MSVFGKHCVYAEHIYLFKDLWNSNKICIEMIFLWKANFPITYDYNFIWKRRHISHFLSAWSGPVLDLDSRRNALQRHIQNYIPDYEQKWWYRQVLSIVQGRLHAVLLITGLSGWNVCVADLGACLVRLAAAWDSWPHLAPWQSWTRGQPRYTGTVPHLARDTARQSCPNSGWTIAPNIGFR